MNARPNIPTVQRSGGRLAPRDNLIRAAVALVASRVEPGLSDEQVLAKRYGDDPVSPLVLRAAVSGATTTAPGWASELSQAAVADFITNLGPASAGSQLLRAGLVVAQERGVSGVTVPGMVAAASGAAFVGEGAPVPVKQFPLATVTLAPRKITSIVAFSREMAKGSSFEEIVRDVLTSSVGHTLDSVLLGTGAASAVAPAGLRAGVAALAASAGGGEVAFQRDIANLVAAVAPVGGTRIALVMNPREWAKAALFPARELPIALFPSAGIEPGAVLAVALSALAVAIDATPELDVSKESTLHLEDSAPAQLTSGTTFASPVRSMFQTDMLSLKITLGVSWGLRASGATAHIAAVTW